MNETPATGMLDEDGNVIPLLAWEDLRARPPAAAFRHTLRELVFDQAGFFERMATTGGLREPLTFLWILLAVGMVMSFPLALSQFALTAPDPMHVSTQVYNLHLLPPRATGFMIVLLPLSLWLCGIATVLQGTVFHIGAKFFGARNWEGSESIWCYANSAALAPVVAAEAVACAISILGWVLMLLWPGVRPAVGAVAHWCLLVLGAAALLCGVAVFFTALVRGCTRSFKLSAEVGLAAAVAGVLLVCAVAAFIGMGFLRWGVPGGVITMGSSVLIMIVLALTHHFAARPSGPVRRRTRPRR